MPKGPNGEKRPADTNACAVNVAKIATEEVEESSYAQPNKVKSGIAGAKARLESTGSERRSQIAQKAARSRWNAAISIEKERRRIVMDADTDKTQLEACSSEKVLMYPNNNLGEQLREFDEGEDVIDVVRETFFPES